MRKNIFSIAAGCLLLGLGSCEQKIDTWSGEAVAYMDMKADSTLVAFAYVDGNESVVDLKVSVMGGIPEEMPREIKLKVSERNAVAGQDYTALQPTYQVEGGKTFCTVPVTVRRPSDKSVKELLIELEANEFFNLHYRKDVAANGSGDSLDRISHRILFHSLMTEAPKTWKAAYLGKFSALKFETICSVMEISKSDFLDPVYMTFGRAAFIGSYMKKYLLENPVMEEDGTPMKMGIYAF